MKKRAALTFTELEFLLSVGAKTSDVLDILNRRGWPATFSQAQLARAEKLGAGTGLRLGMLERLEIGSNRSKRLTHFRAYDGAFSKDRRYSLLVPKGYQVAVSQGGRRLEIRGPGKPEWFGRRTYFLWLIDRGDWRADDERALAAIVAESAVQRLTKGGLKMSALNESTIRDPETKRSFPYFDALGRDPQTGLSGVFSITLRYDAAHDLIAVLGFTKPTAKPGQDEMDDPASILGLIAGSLSVPSKGP